MEIRNNYNQYDSRVDRNPNINSYTAVERNSSKKHIEAYRIDFSVRARLSSEFNDPSIKYPIHNPDVLQYSSNLKLTLK